MILLSRLADVLHASLRAGFTKLEFAYLIDGSFCLPHCIVCVCVYACVCVCVCVCLVLWGNNIAGFVSTEPQSAQDALCTLRIIISR